MPLAFIADHKQAWTAWGKAIDINIKGVVTVISDALRIESKGTIKAADLKPTGVPGTNLGSAVVNEGALLGLVGGRAPSYLENAAKIATGELSAE